MKKMACLLARYNNRCYTDICIRFFMLICLTILVSLDLKCLKNPEITWSIHNLRFFKWLNLDVLWLMPMTLLVQLYSLFQMKINNFTMNKKIVLKKDQCAQRVGTYKYSTKMEIEKTVPAIRIVDGVELPKSNNSASNNKNAGKTLFDKPGDCVSRKNF